MTYALAAPLQEAVFGRLSSDPVVAGHVGTAIFDGVPEGPLPDAYIVLGSEDVTERNDKSARAAMHRFTVSVVCRMSGFYLTKEIGSSVETALTTTPLTLSQGRVTLLNFVRAKARRTADGTGRRIDLTFRALVDDQ